MAFFWKVNVSAVALIHSRKYKCLVGTESVLSGVGGTFRCSTLIIIVFWHSTTPTEFSVGVDVLLTGIEYSSII